MTSLHLAVQSIGGNAITVSTVYRRPDLERFLPFRASTGVTLASDDRTGRTLAAAMPGTGDLIVAVRNDRCPQSLWHSSAVATVRDSRKAAADIRTAVRELRAFIASKR